MPVTHQYPGVYLEELPSAGRPIAGVATSCSVCVTPDSHASGQLTLQNAVDQVGDGGGDICLAPGTYSLDVPVRLSRVRGVRIRGAGWLGRPLDVPALAGPVILRGQSGLFNLDNCINVRLENLALESAASQTAVHARDVTGLNLCNLVTQLAGEPGVLNPAFAFAGFLDGVCISDSQFLAAIGVAVGASDAQARIRSLTIDRNTFACGQVAISFSRVLTTGTATVTRNVISGCNDACITLEGGADPDPVSPGRSPQSVTTISGNVLESAGSGIRVGTPASFWLGHQQRLAIVDNRIIGQGSSGSSVGIAVLQRSTLGGSLRLTQNQVRGFGAGIAVSLASTPALAAERELLLEDNLVEDCASWGVIGIDASNVQRWSIRSNRLLRNGVGGIGCWGGKRVTIAHNTIRGLALDSPPGPFVTGIFADAFPTGGSIGVGPELRVQGNELEEIGPEVFPGEVFGIAIGDGVANWEVSSNLVQRGARGVSQWTALQIGVSARTLILALTEGLRAELGVSPGSPSFLTDFGSGAVLGNRLIGSGKSAARIFMSDGDCTFSNNRIQFVRLTPHDPTGQLGARVHLVVGSEGCLLVSGNSLTQGRFRQACSEQGADISISTASFAVVGNLTDCLIVTNGIILPSPWLNLNGRRPPPGDGSGGGELRGTLPVHT